MENKLLCFVNKTDWLEEIKAIASDLWVFARQKRKLNTNIKDVENLVYLENIVERIRMEAAQAISILNK